MQWTPTEALLAICHLVYHRNDAKVESILKRLEKQNLRSHPGENVALHKQATDSLLDELAMNLPMDEMVPGSRNKALSGLTRGTHSHYQGKVLDILHETALDSSHNTIDSVKASLEQLNHLHLEQMDNNTHPPGAQPTTEEVKFKAVQAEVKQLHCSHKVVPGPVCHLSQWPQKQEVQALLLLWCCRSLCQ